MINILKRFTIILSVGFINVPFSFFFACLFLVVCDKKKKLYLYIKQLLQNNCGIRESSTGSRLFLKVVFRLHCFSR